MPPLASALPQKSPKIFWKEAGGWAKIMVKFKSNSPDKLNTFSLLLVLWKPPCRYRKPHQLPCAVALPACPRQNHRQIASICKYFLVSNLKIFEKTDKSDLDRFDFYFFFFSEEKKKIIYLDVWDLPYSPWPKATLFTVCKAYRCICFWQCCRNTS